MDRSVAHIVRTDVPPDFWRSGPATLTLVALLWTGAFESIMNGIAEPLHTRRLAIALWIGAALWIIGSWRFIRTRA